MRSPARLLSSAAHTIRLFRWFKAGMRFASDLPVIRPDSVPAPTAGPLREFFDNRREGPGVWKWLQYFDAYERHLAKFRGRQFTLLEIGVYSGGSLDMWREYFGPGCSIIGVDIEPSCRVYERPGVRILIGNQAEPAFWAAADLPPLDLVIDDGGHEPEMQRVTLEALLPRIRPGGVYVCEDVHRRGDLFGAFVHGLCDSMNAMDEARVDLTDPERRYVCRATGLQAIASSIHLYPFLVLIELAESPVAEFVAPKRGTQWQPFLH